MTATIGRGMELTPGSVAELFELAETEKLQREHLVRLAAGVLGGVVVDSFFSAGECDDIMSALDGCELGSYNEEVVIPRILKLGPATFEYYSGHEIDQRYWTAAESARAARATLLCGGDPMKSALERVAEAWDGPVRYATCGGRPVFGGLIREIDGGVRMHFDEVAREMPNTMDDLPVAQFAVNCHLAVPESGGELVVYRRRWRPTDVPAPSGYGYDPALADGEPQITVRATLGQAVLFDPRNYHLVRPATGRRLTLSFFLGLLADGALVVWS